ncbi:MAG TPA: GGDEF domain-containing protein [Rhizomicrobium sp.]|jgi:diguanylate cyclase (GGDEF)-like protein
MAKPGGLRENARALGIPEIEFTPCVRDAFEGLAAELVALQRELEQTRHQLEDIERAADRDQLLPVLNRRAFVRDLSRQIASSTRYSTQASLIYFDLDGFKRINDRYGHACGDALLGHFAGILLSHVRHSDVVGRIGGDEFAILLTHAGRDLAEKKALALTGVLHAQPAMWASKPLSLSFSYGILELSPGDTAETAMASADAEMYRHKRTR